MSLAIIPCERCATNVLKLAVVANIRLSVWLERGMREHERIRNRMRVRDERREDGCLWAQWGREPLERQWK